MQNTIERKQIKYIDFNCDLAQSFGIYKNNSEFDLLDYVSSVNISTGFHAGDPLTIKNALLKAKEKNVAIGAHIGFDDIQGFGYREMQLSEEEIEALVIYQVGAIISFAKAYGVEIDHVRAHGAMYELMAKDFTFACNVAKAVKKCSKWLILYGAAGDIIKKAGELTGIATAGELFLNKVYNADLTLNSEKEENNETEFAINRLRKIISTSSVDNDLNGTTPVEIDSIHFSNKYVNSLEIIKLANEIIEPSPVNYNKAKLAGWGEE
ncbi:LamB/YcsF family protein [bacterium]|nr:LamB/YcsF family protein [bacterium]